MRRLLLLCMFLKLHAYELTIISMFHNCGPYIKEWVEYHRLVGADRFLLYDDESTDDWRAELSSYIDSGLVEVFPWPAGKPDWMGAQIEAFQDGLKRSVGVSTWVSLLDQDEFIVPMRDKSIIDCLNNHFSNDVAIYANWYHFGTSKVTLLEKEPMLSRLTRTAPPDHPRNSVGKSIIRPEYALIDNLWTQHFCSLKDGAYYVDGSGRRSLHFKELDLVSEDGKRHTDFIRINHYAHRDENYFQNVRLPRDLNPKLMLEHYESYNLEEDYFILHLLRKYYPKEYKKFWAPYRPKRKN